MTIVLFLHANVTRYFLILVSKGNLTPLLSYFLVKCMSHQSDRVYYKQPIKFIVLKVNGMWDDSIPIQFRTGIFILLWKRRKYLFPHFLWVMLRILVMDEMSFEVWDSAWACCMHMELDIFIVSSKSNMIILFFTRSKFN